MKENIGKFGILYILLALAIGIFIGQMDWFKKLFTASTPSNEGKPCTINGKAGTYDKNNTCIAIDVAVPDGIEHFRTQPTIIED